MKSEEILETVDQSLAMVPRTNMIVGTQRGMWGEAGASVGSQEEKKRVLTAQGPPEETEQDV